jgi:mono/diheme cytochrome c family protein
MTSCWVRRAAIAALISCAGFGAAVLAQGPPTGRGRGGPPEAPPGVQQIPRDPPVDAGLEEQGRTFWAQHCVSCHGSQARGSDNGPNIIRSLVVNNDRSSPNPGSVLGPYLKKGHHNVAALTDPQIVAIAHFVRQRVNDTMRGSPIFVPGDVLTGDAKAGEAFFNGAGGCTTCHNATARNLAGVRSRVINTVDLQQRMLFPMMTGRGGRGRGRGAAPQPLNPNAETVSITPPSGPALSGVLVAQDSFYVTVREASGQIKVVKRVPGMKVVTTNPMQAHIDLLDRLTDKNIHDLVAYLETLK